MMTDTWKLTFGEVVPCCIQEERKKTRLLGVFNDFNVKVKALKWIQTHSPICFFPASVPLPVKIKLFMRSSPL